MAITNHLHMHGGVLALVQSQTRMTQAVKKHLQALSMILSGASFTNCCVLITTKYSPDKMDAERKLRKYETGLETELSAIFSQKYAYNKYIPETQKAFVAAIKENIIDLESLKPGEIFTWGQVVRLAEGDVKKEVEQTPILKQQVKQLENAIEMTTANKRKFENWVNTILNLLRAVGSYVGSAMATLTGLVVVDTVVTAAEASGGTVMVSLGVVGAVAVAFFVKHNRDEAMKMVEKLGKELDQLNQQIKDAKQQLAQGDISALESKAREIRRLAM